jgi:3-oxoacyl-[acyl-carrier-protein] synthase III
MIELLVRSNPQLSKLSRFRYLQTVRVLYDRIGAQSRYVRDTARGERASELIQGAMNTALDKAGLVAGDIDLLIYCGVGRGFIEPANAYFYAKACGMRGASCFDVTDACMSWIRALQIAYMSMRSGACRAAMVINGEFHLGLHDQWEIRSVDALKYSFPMYTIGEAATATVLLPDEAEWSFDYATRSDLADLCTIPLKGYEEFVDFSPRLGLNGLHSFVSFGRELFNEGTALLEPLFKKSIGDPLAKRWYFPHAPATTVYSTNMPKWGVPLEKIYLKVFPRSAISCRPAFR